MGRVSSGSSPNLTVRDYAIVAAIALIGMSAYLVASAWIYRLGFPLDDSWIHATYARNLSLRGEWAFQLGRPSAGSTSPLWTLLLAPGYWIGLGPLWWSHLLGFISLTAVGVVAETATRHLAKIYRPRVPWVGMYIAVEWHMLWAATSGMETLLYATLVLTVLTLLLVGSRRYAALGLLTGLSAWLRPDGVTLLGPVLVLLGFSREDHATRFRSVTAYLIGFAALFVPYLALNLWLSGTPMPNTFYAKQAEYAAWQARPFIYRIWIGLMQLTTGSFALLWPGVAISIFRFIRTRDLRMGAVFVWCVGYALMYVVRLPAYQHGRYLMPAMPTLFLVGILGYLVFRGSDAMGRHHRAAIRVWESSLALLAIGFVVLGARAYGEDVAIIETEMVNTAIWVSDSIPAGAIIAAHDIGALGYYDRHELIDLAGLVSPEVLPFIRHEARLAEFLDRRGAQYLIAFPDVYPELTARLRPIHTSEGPFARAAGVAGMTVYCWRCP